MKKTSRVLIVFLIIAVSVCVGYIAQKIQETSELASHPLKYQALVEKYSKEYEIELPFLYSVIKCESGFDCNATSGAGAKGLMQLMPATMEDMMRRCGEAFDETKMYDPETSIRYGAYYLDYLYKIFNDWDLVLAAYNGGMGNVKKWMENPEYYDGTKICKYPKGFGETERHVKKVNKAKEKYIELYGEYFSEFENKNGGIENEKVDQSK